MSVHVSTSKGFTLVEFLVAIVILSVGLLGLLQAVNVSIASNTSTSMRNAATMVADEKMTLEMAKPFDAITSTGIKRDNVPIKVNSAYRNYSVSKTVTSLSGNTKNVEINVVWKNKGSRYVHSANTLVSKSM